MPSSRAPSTAVAHGTAAAGTLMLVILNRALHTGGKRARRGGGGVRTTRRSEHRRRPSQGTTVCSCRAAHQCTCLFTLVAWSAVGLASISQCIWFGNITYNLCCTCHHASSLQAIGTPSCAAMATACCVSSWPERVPPCPARCAAV